MTREQALAAAEKFVAKVESGRAQSRETYAELKAALALPPRTCGNCRHAKFWHADSGVCRNTQALGSARDVLPDDGCLKGWEAREGEGGEG